MAKRRKRGLLKELVNFPRWMAASEVREKGQNIVDLAKDLTKVEESTRFETFTQAKARLNLTDAEIRAQMKTRKTTGFVFAGIGGLLFLYALVSLWQQSFMALLVSLMLSLIAFVLAFRESFFYMQMKKQKLGCTLAEWVDFILGRDQERSRAKKLTRK